MLTKHCGRSNIIGRILKKPTLHKIGALEQTGVEMGHSRQSREKLTLPLSYLLVLITFHGRSRGPKFIITTAQVEKSKLWKGAGVLPIHLRELTMGQPSLHDY